MQKASSRRSTFANMSWEEDNWCYKRPCFGKFMLYFSEFINVLTNTLFFFVLIQENSKKTFKYLNFIL
jgi:hypothetical protein